MRKAIRVLKTPVTMLALLAILGYGAVWGYKNATADSTGPQTTCVMTDVGGTLTPDKVTVRVLNGGTQGGHAKTTRSYLMAFDFKVIYYNNADREVQTTTIVGNSANDPEVQLLAKMFDGAVTEGDGRADHIVDVIVPTKFQEYDNPPRPSIPVSGPVCLPPVTASSASPSDSASPSATASSTPTKKK
ncbi:MAG: LytR C-terminal domain-containing protein [Actinobacteria bacterium]|nr:LytR C-terminal domain-containing protein [Actinomycetota bacterium]